MFTRQHYTLLAEKLGTHVIPMCLTRDYNNLGGRFIWNGHAIDSFRIMALEMVEFFKKDNPSFNLNKFNDKMISLARDEVRKLAPHLWGEVEGFRISGKDRPTEWTFRTLNIQDFKI